MTSSSIDDPLEVDVLVIGSGISGGTAALALADAGIPVTMISRAVDVTESNTWQAQGGIIYRGKNDSPVELAADIEQAGAGYCNPAAVSILTEHGPRLVEEILIERIGVPFDRTETGDLALALEGGHSIPRIIHAADATGRVIQQAMDAALEAHPNVRLLRGYTAIDLLTPSHHALNRLAMYDPPSCVGAYVFERSTGRVIRVLARQTVLATGGLGEIYLGTSNPPGARGDGVAMANRAGARVINLEFVQFHPTTFYHPLAPSFLISEAVRGDGARLVHGDGKPFMDEYDPIRKDLAPRDLVARAIYTEMLARDLPHVYLDLRSYIPVAKIREHFPNILNACLKYGVDITKDLVPVHPAAHYSCGGIWVNEWGMTTIDRLYAIGEVSCTGVHGANRLASTSLLEGLVWGHRAAQHIVQSERERSPHNPRDIPAWVDEGVQPPDPALIHQDLSVIQHIMWHYVGLARTTPRLERALRELKHLETEIEQFYRVSRLSDELIGLRNAVRTASTLAAAAWENKVSVGCHFRQ